MRERSLIKQARAIIYSVRPLLELFAVVDAVFTEEDALTTHKQVTLGRIYEEWKRCRTALDPDFDVKSYEPLKQKVKRRGLHV